MKILFFSDHFRPEPSAPAAHVYERARLWVEQGHEVTVVTSAPNFPEGKVMAGYTNAWRSVEDMDGIRVVRVKTLIAENKGFVLRTLDYMSYAMSSALIGLFEKKPDVVISTSPHLFVAVGGVMWSRLRGVPHVMEVRDLWPASLLASAGMRKGFVYRMLERLELSLYSASKRIILLTSSFVEDLTSRGVPREKLRWVINGTNLSLFSPRPRDEALATELEIGDRFVVGYLGTVGLSHGLENVLEAAELLRDTRVVFLIVGVGAAKEQLMRIAAERRLTNVVFAPRQPREAMPSFWSLVDVSLIHLKDSPVFATVIPSKIFESMAMGLPILYVGPEGEGSAIVRSHDAGVVVPPANPRALADAVRDLATNTEKRERLAEASLRSAPDFSRERHAEATLAVLREASA